MNLYGKIISFISGAKICTSNITEDLLKELFGITVEKISDEVLGQFRDLWREFQTENLLSVKNMEEMHIPEEYIPSVINEIETFLSQNPITEEIASGCNYKEENLREFLWETYCQKNGGNVEYEGDIKKGFWLYARQWLALLRSGDEFVSHLLLDIKSSVTDVHAAVHDLKTEAQSQSREIKRIADKICTEEQGRMEDPGEIKGLYCIDQDFLKKGLSSGQLVESELQYYRLSGEIQDILDVTSQSQVVENDPLVECIISGMNQEIVIGSKETVPMRVFFVMGEGGMGKTTFLTLAALKIAENTDKHVYLMQIRANEPNGYIEKVIERIDKETEVLLFVDNPYDDLDATRRLLMYVRENRKVKMIFSERSNRLEVIFKSIDLAFISNIAGALLLANSRPGEGQEEKLKKSIKFIRTENLHCFYLDSSWKRQVTERMISYVLPESLTLENETLQNILKRADYGAAPCEIFLRVCMKYNQTVKEESIDVRNLSFKFDWSEWEVLFSSDNGFETAAGALRLSDVFPFLASFGLYKIPVTVEFLSRLTGVNLFALKTCFDRKLRGTEPVRYDGQKLMLKHDVIADLFFLANPDLEPQFYLKGGIRYLDEDMTIPFEKYVLSTKIIRGMKNVPHERINTVELLEEFENTPDLLDYLLKHNRFYSYEYAKFFAILQTQDITEEEFQEKWESMMQKTPAEKKFQLSVWINCFTASMETNFSPPERFFEIIEHVDYRVITDYMSNFETYVKNRGYKIEHYRRIARRTFQMIMERNPEDIPSRLMAAEIMEAQSAVEDAERVLEEATELDTEERYKACVAYAALCKKRYQGIDRKIRKIKKNREKYLCNNKERQEKVLSDDKENPEFLEEQENPESPQILLSDVDIEKTGMEEPGAEKESAKESIETEESGTEKESMEMEESDAEKESTETEEPGVEKESTKTEEPGAEKESTGEKSGLTLWEKRKIYFEKADKYYRLAVQSEKGKGDERTVCALAGFLSQSAKEKREKSAKAATIEEAENYFLKALEIGGNDSSAYNGLAMMYGNPATWNPLYNPEKAEEYFEKAVQNCPDHFMVTRLVPWGNIYYNQGRLDPAKEKYQEALRYKPDEKNAKKALELIREERQAFAELLKEVPARVTSFEDLYCWKRKKEYKGTHGKYQKGKRKKTVRYRRVRVPDQELFREESTQREILRLVYATLQSEELTLDLLETCKAVIRMFPAVGKISNEKEFLFLRIVQLLQRRCDQWNAKPYLGLRKEQTLVYSVLKYYKVKIDA